MAGTRFFEVVDEVAQLLQREGRVSYRGLQREFEVDDAFLEDLKQELIETRGVAEDRDGKMLVWTGQTPEPEPERPAPGPQTPDDTGPAERVRVHEHPTQPPSRHSFRTSVIWLGAILVLVGVFLPWIRISTDMGGGQATGIELHQGMITVAIGLANVLFAAFTHVRALPTRLIALGIFGTGLVVVFITVTGIMEVEEADSAYVYGTNLQGMFGEIMNIRMHNAIGVFIALAGGALLTLGGAMAFLRPGR